MRLIVVAMLKRELRPVRFGLLVQLVQQCLESDHRAEALRPQSELTMEEVVQCARRNAETIAGIVKRYVERRKG